MRWTVIHTLQVSLLVGFALLLVLVFTSSPNAHAHAHAGAHAHNRSGELDTHAQESKKEMVRTKNTKDVKELDIRCPSSSMRPTIDCEDTLLVENLTDSEPMREGAIYVFESRRGGLVAHRLVHCGDSLQCETTLVFKGDNNDRADWSVSRDAVKYKVVGVMYDEHAE